MIVMYVLPCKGCKHCGGIEQPDGTEQSEYVRCMVAENGHANKILEADDKRIYCAKYEKEDEE